ncbi:monovalent cation:proton antiporter family protein [Ottowia thiooxydans]|uniref:monovalent cation:proton antiporter family protein n=1 Tax=Ottowia thiooxydans TaxID=219182 RepID=UPI0004097286|nr:monovalent cation:proton antiporter family protein [Ottowia thiooxydans]
MGSLELALIYLLAAVLGVAACRMLKLPAILGYLVVGVLMEPHTLGLAFGQDADSVKHLAEYGVVFLMFVIGLEFNLPKLRAIRQHVFGLGLAQVALTMALVTFGSIFLAHLAPAHWHMDWRTALALSGAMAMSSTAIVVKMLSDRLELESEHGQRVMGILLLQDLAVVPLLVLIPALGSDPERLFSALALAGLKAVVLISLLLVGGKHVMRWWLTLVARRRSEELFMLNLLLMTLGLAWLTEQAGLSLALGAFICGVLISETEFKYQVESQIRPFHDVLLGLFFITIGMLLDWRLVVLQWPLVLALTIFPVLFKLGLVAGLAKWLGASAGVALRTGLYLAQAGEFGFVLLTLSRRESLLAPELFNPVLAAMVLSMLATPFIIMASNRIVLRLVSSEWLQQSVQMTNIARQSINTTGHVLICGYGRSGQNLARLLEQENIAYMALDLDPDRVRQAAAAGDSVAYGDAARPQALIAAGLGRASAVALTYLDQHSVLKALATIRDLAPQVPVIVRTYSDRDLETLRAAGATEVVPEAIEGSLMLASHALALVGVPMRRVIRIVREQRDARYRLLRGYFHGSDDVSEDELEEERLMTVTVPPDATSGRRLNEVLSGIDAVSVVSLRRGGTSLTAITEDMALEPGDTLLLSGKAEALATAERALTR